MIDKLISSDFGVLAREHRRVPALDAVMPKPVVVAPRSPFAWTPWVLRGAAVGGGALVYVSNDVFAQFPQSLPIIALAVISLLGLLAAPARPSFHRELGAILTAVAMLFASVVVLYVRATPAPHLWIGRWCQDTIASCRSVASIGTDYVEPAVLPIALAAAIALGIGYGVARCIRPRARSLQPWAGLATVITTTLVLAMIVGQTFYPRWIDTIQFSPRPGSTLAQIPLEHATEQVLYSGIEISEWQRLALISVAVLTALVATLALAYRSQSKVATRWLALVSHVTVVPTFVAVAMWEMIRVFMRDLNGDEDRVLAIAATAVLVALASMTVRRERRRVPTYAISGSCGGTRDALSRRDGKS